MGCGSSTSASQAETFNEVESSLKLEKHDRSIRTALKKCADVFLAWDTNSDGVISRDELAGALNATRKKSGKYEPFVERFLFLYGCNVVGAPVTFENFIAITANFKDALKENPKGASFGWRLLDLDNSGAVEARELAFALGYEYMDATPEGAGRAGGLGREEGRKTNDYKDRDTSQFGVGLANAKGKAHGVASMMRSVDIDNDGRLNRSEFRRLLQSYPSVFGVVFGLWDVLEPYIVPCTMVQQRLAETRRASGVDLDTPQPKLRDVKSGKDEVMAEIAKLVAEAPSNQRGY